MEAVILYLCLMAVPALAGALVWLIFLPLRRRVRAACSLKPGAHYETALLIWFMCLAGLLGLTLTPTGFWPTLLRGELPTLPPAFRGGINLQPFHVSWGLLKFYVRNHLWGAVLINFPGNLILFMPVGFFSALFSPRARWWKSTLCAFLLSLAIEIFQLFISRGTDIDDLILNTIGGLLGFWLFCVLREKYPRWIKSCSRY